VFEVRQFRSDATSTNHQTIHEVFRGEMGRPAGLEKQDLVQNTGPRAASTLFVSVVVSSDEAGPEEGDNSVQNQSIAKRSTREGTHQ
jgi:hypothetical protein